MKKYQVIKNEDVIYETKSKKKVKGFLDGIIYEYDRMSCTEVEVFKNDLVVVTWNGTFKLSPDRFYINKVTK